MGNSLQFLRKYSPHLWSVFLAIVVVTFWSIRWWHPSCNLLSDGGGFSAYGIPLPFAQSTVFSMESKFMPHMLVLNLFIVGVLLFSLCRFIFRRLAVASPRSASVAAVVGALLSSIAVALLVFFTTVPGLFIPVSSIADSPESYFSYRPEFIAVRGGNYACQYY